MFEVAEIIRRHGAAYRQKFGDRLLPSHRRVLADLQHCRTPYFGGQLWQCDHCGQRRYSYHSCRNRHCPKCHGDQTARWLQNQRRRLLPCAHYLLTFTLPSELRPLARAHQKTVYALLLQCAAAALQSLARDPRYLGATVGMLGVLHTWTRAMRYHPHVHFLVPAGGLSADQQRWIEPKNPAFLVPVRALSVIFRGKLRDALRRAKLLDQVPSQVWDRTKPWVVHCQHAGSGQKVLEYLARYVFRIAISNSRIEEVTDATVRFRYRDNQTQQLRHMTLTGQKFLARLLQHVLPRGFPKLRYYGWLSSASRAQLAQIRRLLAAPAPTTLSEPSPRTGSSTADRDRCPVCRVGHLLIIAPLPRCRAPP
jgi:rhodanese-related sulfurtransferase